MDTATIIITLAFAVVLTNVLDSMFESLPLPLIQLAVGCLLGLTALETTLELEPELFMALVIAPLLFRESEEADLASLWKVRKQVFLMAFLLVFITVGGIGVAVHLLVPDLPFAACFALGAVLGPTDYVAVASLSSKVKLPDLIITVLKGEALINDASGLISLRFAVAALLTGAFSLIDAALELVVLCVGGFLVGQVIILLKRLLTESLRRMMIRYTDTYLLIELLLPFLSYVIAEMCGVSGILAAVTAGTMQSLDFKKNGLFEAELGIAKRTMWDAVCFVLNSMVFIMLGMQMPGAVFQLWTNPIYDNSNVILVTVLTALIMMGVRFLSLIFLAKEVIGRKLKEKLKNTLMLTLAGVKGVVSMASAISLPIFAARGEYFTERPLLLFIAAGTITMTLLFALFLLPIVVSDSHKTEHKGNRAHIELLQEVVRQLRKKEGAHLGAVIVSYQKRIKDLEHAGYKKNELKQMRSLREFARNQEMTALRKRRKKHEISARTYRDYQGILSIMRRVEAGGMVSYTLAGIWQRVGRLKKHGKQEVAPMSAEAYRHQIRDLFWEQTDLVVEAMDEVRYRYSDKLIAQFVEERINLMGHLIDDAYAGTLRARLHEEYIEELLLGYEMERETIWDFLDEGRLTIAQANELRVNVNKLESYMLSDDQNDVMLKLLALTGDQEQ
ncbi:MAG: sodium:proton antiporter [Clostridiales Family XIII bacterium]|jgi:CPA1 family monovalent cation:H+ antiporter|nr:sodium:proton antiporter [Clostridiales Family XIII bacterium]